jgi:hypothetical protein
MLAFLAYGQSFAFPSGISMSEMEGRWADAGGSLVLDVTPCAEGLCGQKVAPGGECGRTVLTLEIDTQVMSGEGVRLSGKYERTKGVMRISARIGRAPDGALNMQLLEQDASIMRRSLPFNVYLVKSGEPACRPSPVS